MQSQKEIPKGSDLDISPLRAEDATHGDWKQVRWKKLGEEWERIIDEDFCSVASKKREKENLKET